ncbi:MAG: hypothetical protein M1377_00570, partial [Deltaproteobacteria bacterium]|nr:hypothetical protein [Deltaproteobacteria bacterium]
SDFLIPPQIYQRVLRSVPQSTEEVQVVASELGIAPGIVVGRLQHDGKIPRNYFNDLKRHVDFDLCAYFRSVPDR